MTRRLAPHRLPVVLTPKAIAGLLLGIAVLAQTAGLRAGEEARVHRQRQRRSDVDEGLLLLGGGRRGQGRGDVAARRGELPGVLRLPGARRCGRFPE